MDPLLSRPLFFLFHYFYTIVSFSWMKIFEHSCVYERKKSYFFSMKVLSVDFYLRWVRAPFKRGQTFLSSLPQTALFLRLPYWSYWEVLVLLFFMFCLCFDISVNYQRLRHNNSSCWQFKWLCVQQVMTLGCFLFRFVKTFSCLFLCVTLGKALVSAKVMISNRDRSCWLFKYKF